ncbi:MAG: MATE family efflux transporter, partial [Lachnospiraceae bacterium]|nr:MATE family efflux transporter [Lachnospiraceae bacterium]
MKQSDRLSYRVLLPAIFSLAWPTMLENALGTAVQYVDTAMVGSLGTEATAAVGATATVSWLIGSSVSALGIGFLAFISQALGAGEKEKAAGAAGQAALVVLLLGSFFTLLCLVLSPFVPIWMQVDTSIRDLTAVYFGILYAPMLFRCSMIIFGTVLRSAGDTRTPMKTGILVNLINVVLNFLLIYPTRTLSLGGITVPVPGAGLEVVGAALASAVSFVAGGILMFRAVWRHPVISPRGYSLKPDKAIMLPALKVAVPNMLQRMCTSFGYVVFASMINSLGDTATAAHTVANTVESAFYVPGYGMQAAAATLTGNCIGARDKEKLQKLSRLLLWIEVFLMILSGGILFIFAPGLAGIFSSDPEVLLLGTTVLRMVALSEPFYGASIITEGMLQGAGKVTVPFIINVISMWGVRILGTFLCIRFFNGTLVSAWACMIGNN